MQWKDGLMEVYFIGYKATILAVKWHSKELY